MFFLPSSLSCIHLLRLSNRALYAVALLGSTCASTLHMIGKRKLTVIGAIHSYCMKSHAHASPTLFSSELLEHV